MIGFKSKPKEATEETTMPSVLTFQGKSWAVGLEWHIADKKGGTRNIKKYMRSAEKVELDLLCVRKGKNKQFGLGASEKGHKSGMPALASVIADKVVPHDWHGVFQATNGYLHIKVRAQLIDPEGDQFFTSREEAEASFEEAEKEQGWWESYAPAEWKVENTTALGLEEILSESKPNGKLRSATFERDIALGGAVALMIVLIGPSAIEWTSDLFSSPEPPPKPIQPQQPSIDELMLKTTGSLASPDAFLAACMAKAEKHYRGIPGWAPQSVECLYDKDGGSSALISWARGNGTMKSLLDQISRLEPDVRPLVSNGQKFSVAMGLGQIDLQVDQQLYDEGTALFQVHRQLYGLGKTEPQVSSPTGQKENRNGQTITVARYLTVNLSSDLPLENIRHGFSVPGLEIQKAVWSPQTNVWDINAKVFVR